jgi:hypothetical protein
MSRIESLPADQKAVLQLLLERGSTYAELSQLLRIDEAEVRRRAHGALEALGPGDGPALTGERRGQIADYLLGQQSGEQRAATHGFLEGSDAGRAWARAVAGELRPLGGERVPDVPDDGGGEEPADTAPSQQAPPAAAAAEPAPASSEARPARARASRRRGAIALGGVPLAAAAVVLVLALRDSDGGGGATPAATTATTQARQPQVVAQANLVPPRARRGSKALGVVLIQRSGAQQQLVAAVQGLRKPTSGGYGIWLYAGPGRQKWLGFFASEDDQGRLLARGALEESIADYREILVTREAKGSPATPGTIFLRGPIQVARGDGG